jgi:flagellar motor switch protein FliN/FliY
MSEPAAATQKSLLEEYAAELTPTAGELAAALGPAAKKSTAVNAPVPESRKTPVEAAAVPYNLDMVMRIPVTVKIVLGSATMPVANLIKLSRGSVIPLDRRVGEPADVLVNGRVVARGEVVVVDEGTSRFGIKLTEVVGPADADKAA